MSRSASIDISLVVKDQRDDAILRLINLLLSSMWKCTDGKFSFYLPVGDIGDFAWQRDSLSEHELLKIFRKKIALGELIGVAMTWNDTGIGGEFLFRQDLTISINLTINCKVHQSLDITDFNWYLERLLPVLNTSQFTIESVSLFDHT